MPFNANYCYDYLPEVSRFRRYIYGRSFHWFRMLGYGNWKRDTLFSLSKDLGKLWCPAGIGGGGAQTTALSRMVRTVDCVLGASASIVGARRHGRFLNPSSMVANLGSREWIYGLSLITRNSLLHYGASLHIMAYPIRQLCHPSFPSRLIRNHSLLTHKSLAEQWVRLPVLWAVYCTESLKSGLGEVAKPAQKEKYGYPSLI